MRRKTSLSNRLRWRTRRRTMRYARRYAYRNSSPAGKVFLTILAFIAHPIAGIFALLFCLLSDMFSTFREYEEESLPNETDNETETTAPDPAYYYTPSVRPSYKTPARSRNTIHSKVENDKVYLEAKYKLAKTIAESKIKELTQNHNLTVVDIKWPGRRKYFDIKNGTISNFNLVTNKGKVTGTAEWEYIYHSGSIELTDLNIPFFELED